MAIHSSTIAWKIPWTEEPDRLQSMGSQRVRHNWVTSLSLFKTQTVVMYGWELDCEESWASKNRCFWTVVLEKTLESPLDCKELQPVHSKGDQSWVFIGGTDIEAETPILWPPHAKSWLIEKDPDAWEGLRAGGEGDDRGWDGWMASLTRWTWVWVNSRSWWWTGRPGVLQFMGSQGVRHDWATELNWKSLQMAISAMKLKDAYSLEGKPCFNGSGSYFYGFLNN